MVEDYHIAMVVETILLLMITVGSYYGRKLDMSKHHYLTYGAILGQLTVFFSYMLPGFLFAYEQGFLSTLMMFHGISGSITLILSVFLAVVFLKDGNDFDLKKLRYTRPLMIATLFFWVMTYMIGLIFFIDVRL